MLLNATDRDVIEPRTRPWFWISADTVNQLSFLRDISHRWLLLVGIIEDTDFPLAAEQVLKLRLHTCVMRPQYVRRPSACKFKDRPSNSQRRKSARGRGKEGEGETDRRWLSWADIFWEPVLRLPGAIFKRPTSPHSPGGCRGERRGLMHVNTGAPHVDMSHYKLLMDTQHAQTKVRPEATRTGPRS